MKQILTMMLLGAAMLFAGNAHAQFTLAEDNAGNYGSGWSGNGGFGFNEWTFTTNPSGGFAGQYRGGVGGLGDPAFGLFSGGNDSATSSADRTFKPMVVGTILSLDLGHTPTINGEISIQLLEGTTTRLTLKFVNGDTNWKLNDGGSDFSIAQPYSANTSLSFTFTFEGDNKYSYSFGSASGNNFNFSSSINTIDGIRIFSRNQGNDQNFGVNNLSITNPNARVSIERTVQTVEEVEQYRGWRLLSSPATVPFNTWLSGIWTQGGNGANTTHGTSNVFSSVGSTTGALARTDITNFGSNVVAGQGYAVYVYENHLNNPDLNAWPKTLSFSGAENAAGTTFTPAHTSGTQYAIAGNPFSATIQFDNLTRGSDLANKVWVYNPATDNVIARAAGSGDFNGLITPFQGFWIEYTGATSTLTFPAAAKSSGGTFYAKEVQHPRLVMDFTDGTFSNSAWVTFDQNASEGYDQMDAVQFAGMAGSGAMLYTIVDGKSVDINFLPLEIIEPIELPIGYYTSLGGEVKLSVRDLMLPAGLQAYIRNDETGEIHQLQDEFELRFQAPVNKVNPNLDALVASADASGLTLVLSPNSVTSTDQPQSDLPASVTLSQNFPNPFNPTTSIRFELPERTEVRLAVYDLTGREVAILANGAFAPGSHSVNFSAAELSSGVYVYRLDAAGQTLTRKMTLIK
jgi:hypothetical protein